MAIQRTTIHPVRAAAGGLQSFWSKLAKPAVVCLALLGAVDPAFATRVPNLFGADVDATGASGSGLDAAFDAALALVLVKVTGLPEAGDPAARKRLFPNPAALVQKYTVQPGNRLRVDFDPTVMRRALDRAGLPLWDADRPLVAIWLAVDVGADARFILSDGSAGNMELADFPLADMQQALLSVAGERGLPVVLPLLDAQDITRVKFGDVWEVVREPVLAASERYGAEAVLIGRTNSLDVNDQTVRWTLLIGDDEASWQGTIAAGPAEAATVLSRQLATYADAGGAQRVIVTGVASLAGYGSLLQYFRSLPIVEQASIARVDGQTVEFDLAVRGDADRLRRTLDTSAFLSATNQPQASAAAPRGAELVYAFRGAR